MALLLDKGTDIDDQPNYRTEFFRNPLSLLSVAHVDPLSARERTTSSAASTSQANFTSGEPMRCSKTWHLLKEITFSHSETKAKTLRSSSPQVLYCTRTVYSTYRKIHFCSFICSVVADVSYASARSSLFSTVQ